MRDDNNKKAFFALLRSGLWEKDVLLIASQTPADPEQPQETKEEKNAWNEGLW